MNTSSELQNGASRGTSLGPARARHLAKAPIAEALIDFRVQLEEAFSFERLNDIVSRLSKQYPKRVEIKKVEAKVGLGDPIVLPDVKRGDFGVLIRAADEKSVAQFRLDGFTFNRLHPYTSWDDIYPETMRLWKEYVAVAKPIEIVRLAARYINRLTFTLPINDLKEYLTEPPQIPEGLPQTLRGYLTRLVVHDSVRDQSAIVTQSFEPNPTEPEQAIILLDIDAFKDVHLKPSDEAQIDLVFSRLHDFKNEIFFRSITQKASELFE
jgi:uncharacterized protein (TIGR04255 family)